MSEAFRWMMDVEASDLKKMAMITFLTGFGGYEAVKLDFRAEGGGFGLLCGSSDEKDVVHWV